MVKTRTEAMTTDIDALIAEWREAAKGVTPEEWAYTLCDDGIPMVHTDGDIICWPDPNHGSDGNRPDAMDTANLAWIARCSPTGISALLDTIEALKAERDELQSKLIRAWNAFGSPPFSESFTVDDLDHLHVTAGGDLDEQIKMLEGMLRESTARAAAAEARLAEVERDEAKDEGATFVLDALAKAIGLEQWQIHDGTETWDGDVCASLYGILREAGVLDPETDELATRRAESLRVQLERAREALEPFSSFAGELFARNYNKNDPVITIEGQSEFGTVEVSLTFEAFINARRALKGENGNG